MHVVLSSTHIISYIRIADSFSVYLEGFTSLSVVFQVFNLVNLATVYARSPGLEAMDRETQAFHLWICIELLMIVFLIVSNILAVFVRSFFRN